MGEKRCLSLKKPDYADWKICLFVYFLTSWFAVCPAFHLTCPAFGSWQNCIPVRLMLLGSIYSGKNRN